LRETTSIETSCAEGRLRGLAETVQQPTLKVDIEVEGNLVPAAVAGHYTFPQPEGCAGARKYYTCAVDNPDPEPDTPTELIAVSLNRNDGFVLKSWTGNCAYYNANGVYLGMLPQSVPEDPEDWITNDTIYVKCLVAQQTQTASAMTDMAVLAGATAEGAAQTVLAPISAWLFAQVEFAPNPTVVRENGNVAAFTETEEDQALLAKAGFVPATDDINRWAKTTAYPGELFKLTITDPPRATLVGLNLTWDWVHDPAHAHIKLVEKYDPVHAGGDPNKVDHVCYVEPESVYVAQNPPIGILRISVVGGQKPLKTIVVDYGAVRVFELTALKHENLQNPAPVAQWLEDATNEIFLLDEIPLGQGIKDRYDNVADVNCPIAFTLASLGTFSNNDVENRDALGTYEQINDLDEYVFFVESDWPVAHGKDILIVDGILYHKLLGPTPDCSAGDLNGWVDAHKHVYLSAAMNGPRTLAHELGHYMAGLPDRYYCHQPAGGCDRTPSDCICTCPPPNNRPRGDHHPGPGSCQCGFVFAPWRPKAPNENNVMSNAADNWAVLEEQKNDLLQAPERP